MCKIVEEAPNLGRQLLAIQRQPINILVFFSIDLGFQFFDLYAIGCWLQTAEEWRHCEGDEQRVEANCKMVLLRSLNAGLKCHALNFQHGMSVDLHVLHFFFKQKGQEDLRAPELVREANEICVGYHVKAPCFDAFRFFEFLIFTFNKGFVLSTSIFLALDFALLKVHVEALEVVFHPRFHKCIMNFSFFKG